MDSSEISLSQSILKLANSFLNIFETKIEIKELETYREAMIKEHRFVEDLEDEWVLVGSIDEVESNTYMNIESNLLHNGYIIETSFRCYINNENKVSYESFYIKTVRLPPKQSWRKKTRKDLEDIEKHLKSLLPYIYMAIIDYLKK